MDEFKFHLHLHLQIQKINPIGGIFSELEELIGGIFLMKSKNKCPQEAPSGLGGAKFTPIGGIFFVQKPP